MGVGSGMAIAAGLGAAGSLGGAALESNAAGNAASTQANAAEYNAQLQAELGQEQLGYENYQYQQGMANQMPWLQSGANSLATLDQLMGIPSGGFNGTPAGGSWGSAGGTAAPAGGVGFNGSPVIGGMGSARANVAGGPGPAGNGSTTLSIPGVQGSVNLPGVRQLQGTAAAGTPLGALMQAYPGGQFQAPTAEQARNTPGYQFALQQGENAMQASAAANGSLLTGGTLAGLNNYAQGMADTNYNNTYNQALQGYNTNYNVWSNNQANLFNRLAAMSGMGQTAANQLSNAGLATAGMVGNTLSNTGNAIANQNMNAANATASGYMNSANAWAQGLGGLGTNLGQLMGYGQNNNMNTGMDWSELNPWGV